MKFMTESKQIESRVKDEVRIQKDQERTKFMTSKLSSKPYEEMKLRFLS